MRYAAIFMIAIVCSAAAGFAEPVVGLRQLVAIPLPGVEGRFDHFAIDAKGNRLFVAALGNNSVEVIDTKILKRLRSIRDVHKPAGVAYMADANRLAVGCGDDEACVIFNAKSYSPVERFGWLSKLPDADNVRYDEASRTLYCGYGEGALAVFDAHQGKAGTSIELGGHPESFQLEAKGNRIFVNVPESKSGPHVAVIDRLVSRVAATWPLTQAGANFPMAIDAEHHRLLIGCRKPAKLLVLDTETGKTVAAVDCAGDADDLFYDAATKRIYVSGGEGFLSVIWQRDADHYEPIGRIQTAPGARTCFFSAVTGRLYLAVPHHGEQRAEIRVFERDQH
jgi:YVTN family beta-propeller protein